MPAIINEASLEFQIAEAHSVELQNKAFRAQNAYNVLFNYDFNALGVMPNVTWSAPTGVNFDYSSSNGELHYNSTAYSSLASDKKREFFQYLPKFIQACLDAYDDTYSL